MSEDVCAFTIRIPRALKDQIEARAKLHHRKRNQEINVLLEVSIDRMVETDRETIKNSGGRQEA